MNKLFILFLSVLLVSPVFCRPASSEEASPLRKSKKVSEKKLNQRSEGFIARGKYPAFGNRFADKAIKQLIKDTVEIYKNESAMHAAEGLTCTLDVSYEAYGDFVNFAGVMLDFSYYYGGERGAHRVVTKNFDLLTDMELQLYNIFKDGADYISRISPLAVDSINKSPDVRSNLNWILKGAGPKKENFRRFALDKDRVIFYFEPLEVAPQSNGVVKAEILLEDIKNILNPYLFKR
ncbi:MAG: RsiV family protein [Elusimicrobiota bacterium]